MKQAAGEFPGRFFCVPIYLAKNLVSVHSLIR